MIATRCEVTTHGERQLELNVAYPLAPDRRRAHYQLDLYLFNPYQLGMTEGRYGVAGFLRDLRSYTRYTVPTIALAKLVDPACALSPLTRIARMLEATTAARDLDETAILYELRVLANIYHAQLRDTRRVMEDQCRKGAPPDVMADRLTSLLAGMDRLLERFRALRPVFLDPRVSDRLREGLNWADEALSVSTEKAGYMLYHAFRERADLAEAVARLTPRLAREQRYRRDAGYPTVIDPRDPIGNERFVYHESLLKKWAEGCMYMSQEPTRAAGRIMQAVLGVAAALAMAFAVTATFFTSRWFPEFSVPWAILIVVAYVVKDRLKEALRGFFVAHVPRFTADRMDDLIDPAVRHKVGVSRARVRFRRPAELPDAIRRLRELRSDPFREIMPPDDVIHFQKDIFIESARLMRSHPRLESITEIIRFKLDSWLAGMDDPTNLLSCMVGERCEQVPARRVYHLHLILRFADRTAGEAGALFKYRLVLTRNGIVRIEPLDTL